MYGKQGTAWSRDLETCKSGLTNGNIEPCPVSSILVKGRFMGTLVIVSWKVLSPSKFDGVHPANLVCPLSGKSSYCAAYCLPAGREASDWVST